MSEELLRQHVLELKKENDKLHQEKMQLLELIIEAHRRIDEQNTRLHRITREDEKGPHIKE